MFGGGMGCGVVNVCTEIRKAKLLCAGVTFP